MLDLFKDMENVVLVLVCVNVVIGAVGKVLDTIKDKTAGTGDDKAASVVHTIADALKTAIDWLGGNRKH